MTAQSEAGRTGVRSLGRASTSKLLVDFPARLPRLVSEHRQRRRTLDRKLSDQSRRALDWTNFFLADVQVGFGAFLAFYLASLGTSAEFPRASRFWSALRSAAAPPSAG